MDRMKGKGRDEGKPWDRHSVGPPGNIAAKRNVFYYADSLSNAQRNK